jgi:hypothetical protein
MIFIEAGSVVKKGMRVDPYACLSVRVLKFEVLGCGEGDNVFRLGCDAVETRR